MLNGIDQHQQVQLHGGNNVPQLERRRMVMPRPKGCRQEAWKVWLQKEQGFAVRWQSLLTAV